MKMYFQDVLGEGTVHDDEREGRVWKNGVVVIDKMN